MRHHFTHRLVVRDDTSRRRIYAEMNGLAVDTNLVAILDTLPDVRGLVVDRNAPFENQLLHLQPRTHACLRQYFMQLGRFHLRQQHALLGRRQILILGCIQYTRDNILKPIAVLPMRATMGSALTQFAIWRRTSDTIGCTLRISLRTLRLITEPARTRGVTAHTLLAIAPGTCWLRADARILCRHGRLSCLRVIC